MTLALVFDIVATALVSLSSAHLKLGSMIGEGTFGEVRWSSYNDVPCVAKQAKPSVENAAYYLEIEEHANALLRDRARGSIHFAPYLGTLLDQSGAKQLLWHACGGATLGSYVRRGLPGTTALADALGCASSAELSRAVLREQLVALSTLHAVGLVHRDVKPDNWLVDEDERSLRLIDLGSSCDVASWGTQRGYKPERVPCSVLFCPPEQLLAIEAPYTYDVYSAALVWLCVALPAVGQSEEALYALRMSLKDHGHRVAAWKAAAEEDCAPPIARWRDELDVVFGSASGQGQQAGWQLLAELLAPSPHERPTAAEALLSPFLNADCERKNAPMPAPRPWSLEGLVANAGAALRREPQRRLAVAEECSLE